MSAKTTGCGGDKSVEGVGKTASATRSASFLTDKLKKQDSNTVKSMSARAQLNMNNDGQSMSASANIIWFRDSALWVNVKKFGFEAARALITRDSVYLLNRLEKTYSAKGLESIQRQYNLPAGFELIQQTLLAHAWMFPGAKLNSSVEDGLHKLIGTESQYAAAYWIEDGSFLLKKEHFVRQQDEKMITLGFDKFQKVTGIGQFPYFRSIEAYSPDTGNTRLDVEFSDVEINTAQPYRFEIPAHYKRVD
jgi:hypothetical protein